MQPSALPPMRLQAVVLDTNAVLDWLLFRDPAGAALWQALELRQIEWWVTADMQAELQAVLARPLPARWEGQRQALQAGVWGGLSTRIEAAVPHAQGLRCDDPDDQKFLDLALQHQVDWLVTRDRALLRLARGALARGVRIGPPASWQPQPQPGGDRTGGRLQEAARQGDTRGD